MADNEILRRERLKSWFREDNPERNRLMFQIRDYFNTNLLVLQAREIDEAWWKVQEEALKRADGGRLYKKRETV